MKYWTIILVSVPIGLVIGLGISLYFQTLDLEKPCKDSGGTYYEGRTKEDEVKLKWCELEGRVYQGREILKLPKSKFEVGELEYKT